MPNWCEGPLKVRGTREDIKRFLTEGLEAINSHAAIHAFLGNDVTPHQVHITVDEFDMTLKAEEGFYIKGTSRAIIEGPIVYDFLDSEIETLTIECFKQAWDIQANEFAKISKMYNIDIRIYGFERGMEFNREIEIHKGEIIKNTEIAFDDYEWECPFPNMGG
ncbi:hypothetical protein [Rossellomorea marisflavi]|uniref:hypothetical protein n=1 Tax=Rossellomorea marisflavi TaxID=189381 RepID=UPI00345CEE88